MMGKFANLEIIPLDDNNLPPVNNQQNSFRNRPPSVGLQPGMHRMPFISDPTIIPRVQKVREYSRNNLLFFLFIFFVSVFRD